MIPQFAALLSCCNQPPPAPGQQVFTTSGTFTPPAGVYSISMVAVLPGGDASANGTEVVVGGVTVCRAKNGGRIGDGGGDGGAGAAGDDMTGGGGGGAAGYSANGNTGSGGSAATGYNGQYGYGGRGGGGVGLLGAGSSGAANTGAAGSGGAIGQDPGAGVNGGQGGAYGGGRGGNGQSPGSKAGAVGGALSYKNNVAVIPGQAVTVTIPTSSVSYGAVRIIWGPDRAYPATNTADM